MVDSPKAVVDAAAGMYKLKTGDKEVAGFNTSGLADLSSVVVDDSIRSPGS